MKLNEVIETEKVWLTCSCFTAVRNWNGVLHAAADFLKIIDRKIYSIVLISFNHENGANVRLSFLTFSNNTETLANTLDEYFGLLLTAFPRGHMELPIQSMFLPFPTNSIQYGLYELSLDENTTDKYWFQSKLSELMLEVISTDEIDMETLVSFASYLTIILTKTFLNSVTSCTPLENFLGNLQLITSSAHTTSKIPPEEASIMLEVIKDIMGIDKFENDLVWVNKWIFICNSVVRKHDLPNASPSLIPRIFQTHCSFIFELLGLPTDIELRTIYIINHSLQIFYKIPPHV